MTTSGGSIVQRHWRRKMSVIVDDIGGVPA
jgi:hypothetical protein